MGRAFKAHKLRVSASRFGIYLMSEGSDLWFRLSVQRLCPARSRDGESPCCTILTWLYAAVAKEVSHNQ